jgi:polysaccharide export outer membrane protein
VVGAPDQLAIHILPDPVIERVVRVRTDGMISVDLVGDVRAAGRTPLEIASDIQQQIARFKRDAVVNVTVESSPSQFVTVFGEVMSPGIFSLDTETRVSEAIGRVGGTRPFANLDGIRLIRSTGQEPQIFEIDLQAIQRGDLSTNYVVDKGDLIVVPPTIFARVGYVMQALLFPLQPFISAASTTGSIYGGINAIGGD